MKIDSTSSSSSFPSPSLSPLSLSACVRMHAHTCTIIIIVVIVCLLPFLVGSELHLQKPLTQSLEREFEAGNRDKLCLLHGWLPRCKPPLCLSWASVLRVVWSWMIQSPSYDSNPAKAGQEQKWLGEGRQAEPAGTGENQRWLCSMLGSAFSAAVLGFTESFHTSGTLWPPPPKDQTLSC